MSNPERTTKTNFLERASLTLGVALLFLSGYFAAFAVWKVDRLYGAILFAGLASVAVAVCATKQHFVVDVLGGLIVAALVGGIVLEPYRQGDGKGTYSWRGPASYVASLALMYLGFYGAYLLPR